MTQTDSSTDCIVIGAGIAGASVAAELAAHCPVILIERETQPGYHTTGRSAAVYAESYGPPVIRALTRASRSFFHAGGGGFPDRPLLHPCGLLFVARSDQAEALEALEYELRDAVARLSAEEVAARQPLLRDGYACAGLWDGHAADIDVNGLHQHYLKLLRSRGGSIQTNAEVTGLSHADDWQVETRAGIFKAPVVINAAGAWGDQLAQLAGIEPVGLTPKRRTVMIVGGPDRARIDDWPMTVDAQEQFYLKPDAGKLLISPADATPSPPCDAQPDELDVAICVDRIQRAFDLNVRRIDNKWAGLRSFLPDGSPMADFDPDASGFFWLVGQGGYGIQSAPAMARTAAALVRGQDIPADISDHGIVAQSLCHSRKRQAA
ncbi:NAD(P)/FAD-dependent oxidoreductase [Sedimentitalea nanhaiensis]|uniref:D-arginine dehydrogenase n=1 Tax=Sedimentitalea nanhaiensis TaxID=999627 RepID=A0A1I7C553_9RHOB|nr:FAD-dependent oxidoreductase [Sedimentitalea nanhaiensis]SFT94563.1 D-arginine dehydrogenase [Sedimentitalea nanhaiensis]